MRASPGLRDIRLGLSWFERLHARVVRLAFPRATFTACFSLFYLPAPVPRSRWSVRSSARSNRTRSGRPRSLGATSASPAAQVNSPGPWPSRPIVRKNLPSDAKSKTSERRASLSTTYWPRLLATSCHRAHCPKRAKIFHNAPPFDVLRHRPRSPLGLKPSGRSSRDRRVPPCIPMTQGARRRARPERPVALPALPPSY